jgi:hypothetical protein
MHEFEVVLPGPAVVAWVGQISQYFRSVLAFDGWSVGV